MDKKYISTDLESLAEALKTSVVTFEYSKKDGTLRTAKGTLKNESIPAHVYIEFEKKHIDVLVQEHNYNDVDDYAKNNNMYLAETTDSMYRFRKISRKKSDDTLSYFDLDKESFRSFSKENYLGIISIE